MQNNIKVVQVKCRMKSEGGKGHYHCGGKRVCRIRRVGLGWALKDWKEFSKWRRGIVNKHRIESQESTRPF